MRLKTAIKCSLFATGIPIFLFLWILEIDNKIALYFLKDILNDLNKKHERTNKRSD